MRWIARREKERSSGFIFCVSSGGLSRYSYALKQGDFGNLLTDGIENAFVWLFSFLQSRNRTNPVPYSQPISEGNLFAMFSFLHTVAAVANEAIFQCSVFLFELREIEVSAKFLMVFLL